ncbi:hypothetical protein PEBR_07322 [Penicillium brasilianum]|uniref:Uncharacterized protein n=1 Tax=Penicillium brasilianum TaxID=104259 RepID=A0A1S9RWH0_PENBI|nr:hypothetical protein PEBR_07322 [Penicillium brasilianum]
MSAVEASHLRLGAWGEIPNTANLINLVPMSDGSEDILVAIDTLGNYYWPFVCAIQDQLNKVFLVQDYEMGASVLEGADLVYTVAGGVASNCSALALEAEGCRRLDDELGACEGWKADVLKSSWSAKLLRKLLAVQYSKLSQNGFKGTGASHGKFLASSEVATSPVEYRNSGVEVAILHVEARAIISSNISDEEKLGEDNLDFLTFIALSSYVQFIGEGWVIRDLLAVRQTKEMQARWRHRMLT